MKWFSFVSISAVLSTTAAVVPSTHGVHEQRDVHSSRWTKLGRVRPEAILPVRIALAQNNLDKGHDYLMDISHPHSPNYGKHWTADEVIEAFKPNDADVEVVRDWLVGSGIPVETITHSDNKAVSDSNVGVGILQSGIVTHGNMPISTLLLQGPGIETTEYTQYRIPMLQVYKKVVSSYQQRK